MNKNNIEVKIKIKNKLFNIGAKKEKIMIDPIAQLQVYNSSLSFRRAIRVKPAAAILLIENLAGRIRSYSFVICTLYI